MSKAYLILENGSVFEGTSFGADVEVCGELVFNTGVVGYIETLTDPSYFGQIVIQTFPLIGNYGIIPSDFESENVWPSAYIVREWCQEPSNFRNEGCLDAFLKSKNIPALCGIDTRALTRLVRQNGVMNAMISSTPTLTDEQWAALKGFAVKGGVEAASVKAVEVCEAAEVKYNTVMWDFGEKNSMVKNFTDHGCRVVRMPYSSTAEEIAAQKPDGIVITNGPGDPAENTAAIAELKKLCATGIPMFGVGLGHQLLALANGAETEKLLYGHRGSNQPVCDSDSDLVFVTNQNHGYAVKADTLPAGVKLRFSNCNDGTCEGLEYSDIPAFSVQFEPVGCAGPNNADWLITKFTALMDDKMAKGGDC